jgi:acetyl-CoA carboxylase biotin carboxyl carrier protein
MTQARNDDLDPMADASLGPRVEAVREAALDLLASLPQRPERLRVRAADVAVELDWRSLPAPVPESSHRGEPAEQRGPEPASGGQAGPTADGGPGGLHYVCAPTIGTFYQAPEPGAQPFVAEGATVTPGQQIGIIEAMKLMLPVEADRAGRVVEVLVANGQAVEYGERLLVLGPVDTIEERVAR